LIIPRFARVAAGGRAIALAAALLASAPLSSQEDRGPGSLELGGTQRTRYETLDGQFRAGLDATDRALALQTSLTFDWRRADLQVFGEIMDARVALDDPGSYLSASQTNTLEPVQAYVAWRRTSSATPGRESTLRAGRMTLDVGKRRLLARSRFRNTVDSFAGIDFEWLDADGRAARAFYLKPMNTLPGDDPALLDDDFELDRGMRRNELLGAYYRLAPFADDSTAELYAFEHRLRPTADPLFEADMAVDHLTVGSRLYRAAEPGRLNFELEAAVQRGSSGGLSAGIERTDLEHRAHFVHFEVGYELAAPASPNIVFQYDLASGDEDPDDARNERFDTLYGDRSFEYGPTGLYGTIARANLRSPGVRLTFRAHARLRCVVAYRRVRLDEPRDEWAGSDYRDPTGASGSSVGRHLEASVAWEAIDDRLQVDAGVARLAAGSFLARVAGPEFNGSPRYFYLGATTTF
jgi:hypothetical protein